MSPSPLTYRPKLTQNPLWSNKPKDPNRTSCLTSRLCSPHPLPLAKTSHQTSTSRSHPWFSTSLKPPHQTLEPPPLPRQSLNFLPKTTQTLHLFIYLTQERIAEKGGTEGIFTQKWDFPKPKSRSVVIGTTTQKRLAVTF